MKKTILVALLMIVAAAAFANPFSGSKTAYRQSFELYNPNGSLAGTAQYQEINYENGGQYKYYWTEDGDFADLALFTAIDDNYKLADTEYVGNVKRRWSDYEFSGFMEKHHTESVYIVQTTETSQYLLIISKSTYNEAIITTYRVK